MYPLFLVSLTVGSGFNEAFDEWCREHANYFSSIDGFLLDFKAVFDYAVKNPLLVSIIPVILVVLCFHLFSLIFRTFRR